MTHEHLDPIAWLKDVGSAEDPCYVPCAEGDPGGFPVFTTNHEVTGDPVAWQAKARNPGELHSPEWFQCYPNEIGANPGAYDYRPVYDHPVGWRTIASAPKDGTPVLVFYPTKYGMERYSVRYWSSGDWGKITEGWVDAWRQISPNDEPTHWCELEPPTASSSAGSAQTSP